MIFAPSMVAAILESRKTQTRRVAYCDRPTCTYQVGRTYSVQPGRGKPAKARLHVTGVRRERLWRITDDDVRAEGFVRRNEFADHWKQVNGSLNWDDDVWVITFELVKP